MNMYKVPITSLPLYLPKYPDSRDLDLRLTSVNSLSIKSTYLTVGSVVTYRGAFPNDLTYGAGSNVHSLLLGLE